MQTITKFIITLDDKMGLFASITLLANMFLIVYSVLGRVFFAKPVSGLVDMVSLIFALTCVFSFCYTEKNKGHVRMDLFLQKAPRAGKFILHSATGIIAILILGFIVVSMYSYVSKTFAAGNITLTIGIPIFPFALVTAISMTFFLATLVLNFYHAYEDIKQMRYGG